MNVSPSKLSDLVGQSRAVAVIRRAILNERLAHAYLFSGPQGVGKSTAALLFAQVLNCEQRSAGETTEACGSCRSCLYVARGTHPDVTWTGLSVDDRGRLRTEITIDQVRRLIRDVGLKPMVGRYKVYVVDPAEAMNQYSANALLKAIEEPPGPVVWVLVASQPSALLPTILSRCQKVGFQLAGIAAVENHLCRLGANEEDAVSLAALSGGRIGWAVSALQRPEVLAARTALVELCAETDSWDSTASLRLADDIKRVGVGLAEAEGSEGESEDSLGADAASQSQGQRVSMDRRLRAELPWCLDVMASWYRDRLAARAGGQVLNADHEAAVRRDLGGSAAGRAEQAVEMIHRAKLDLQHNANVDLALEALAVRLLAAGSR